MDSVKQLELQAQIKENSSGIMNSINALHKWEKDIKRNSAGKCQTKKSENEYPIRSHKQNLAAYSNGFPEPSSAVPTPSSPVPKHPDAEPQKNEHLIKISDANSCKEMGNGCVKNQDFVAASKHYSDAIQFYDKDPIFYCNRAFCFLKLERYTECINDCSKAIELNPNLVKAFYRRMQANEVLCNFHDALKDCKRVLTLDPKNSESIKADQRLLNRIAGKGLSCQTSKNTNFTWSKLDDSFKDVNYIQKPPHLRSKKPLHRIAINQPPPTNICTQPDKKSKDEENEAYKSADMHVDQSNQSDEMAENVFKEMQIQSPPSSAQFYRTWRELVEFRQKYSYLKIINISNLNKLLGPQFSSEMLKDLLKILSEFFIRDNIPVTEILKQIIINEEFKILKMFMDTDDKNAFEKLFAYMEKHEQKLDEVAFIKEKIFN